MLNYTNQRLQFGSQIRVPGYEVDLQLANPSPAPVALKLVVPATNILWDLIFSYESGNFYLADQAVPGIDKAIIQSWYNQEGSIPGGNNALILHPFVIDDTGESSGFSQATHFVDFSQPTPTDNFINTDTIASASVTATVHQELPEYADITIATQATSHSLIITTTKTQAVFDKIFVLWGDNIPVGNTLTVQKNQSCQALAIFKKTSSSDSMEISIDRFPKIPIFEWPEIISGIVSAAVLNEKGEVYEYLSPKVIASLNQETLKSAIASISQRIEYLEKIKTFISGL